MSGFPKLIPAFTAKIPIAPPNAIGSTQAGSLNQVSFLTDEKHGGGLKSEPGYAIPVDAVFVHGADYIRADPDGSHVRLNVTSVLKDSSGALFTFNYTGTIAMGGAASRVLGGSPDAKTTEYGDAFTSVKFESGDKTLKALENKVYVGSGHFVLQAGQPVVVEYKISEVAQ